MSGAGLAIGKSEYEREANAYLQKRLQVIYWFVLGSSLLFLALDFLAALVAGSEADLIQGPSTRGVHSAGIVALVVHVIALRRGTYGAAALRYFDAFLVLGTMTTCMAIYAVGIEVPGAQRLLWIAALLVVGRGIAVPSSVRWTFLLSLSVPLGLLVVRALWPIDQDHAGVHLMWDLSIAVLAVALSTFASAINFRLRAEVRTARQLGQYSLDEPLGEGAMGTVYRATHSMLRRPTAIKVLRPEVAGEETIARFEREVQQTALLQHPNTVSIYDYGRTPDGLFYYAMELLDGEDLATLLERSGPFPPARVIHILRQVCGSLHEAHSKGLVHRDVKAGNIVLCRRAGLHDVAKVVDFGLVKDLSDKGTSVTRMGMLCGTPETIAPEVLSGEEPDGRADLYAVGIVGYRMLAGRLPFDAKTAAELIGAHLHEIPRPLDDAPDDLAAVVMRCLAKDPRQRPDSAATLREQLGQCADAGAWTETDAADWWTGYRDGSR